MAKKYEVKFTQVQREFTADEDKVMRAVAKKMAQDMDQQFMDEMRSWLDNVNHETRTKNQLAWKTFEEAIEGA